MNSGKTIRKVIITWGKFELEGKIVHLAERKPLPPKIKLHKECREQAEQRIKCPHCKALLQETEKKEFCPECRHKIVEKKKIHYCPCCKKEIDQKEMLKAYRIGKKTVLSGKEEQELKKLYPKKNRLLIEKFVPLKSLNFIYFEKSYLLLPEEKSAYSYFLLKKGLEETETAALGSVFISKNYYRVIVRPESNFLLLALLFYNDEINFPPRLKEQKIALSLMELMEEGIRKSTYRFKPETDCKNTYKENLLKLLEKKPPLGLKASVSKKEIESITLAIQENIKEILKNRKRKK
jgi:Ku protein